MRDGKKQEKALLAYGYHQQNKQSGEIKMSTTIYEVIQNAEQLWREGNHHDKNFNEEARKLDTHDMRILEVSKGSDLLKVTRIHHHCKEAWNNDVKQFAEQALTNKLTSVADKNKDIKDGYVWRVSNRIDAALCPAMVKRFPELCEYAQRWEAWKNHYYKTLQDILSVTAVYENPRRETLRLELFKVNYYAQHDILKDLIHELLHMTKGAEPYIFPCSVSP